MKRKLWHYLLLFSVTVTGLSSCSDEADTKVADSPKGIATANHTATDDEPVIVIIGASTAAGRGASTPSGPASRGARARRPDEGRCHRATRLPRQHLPPLDD